jgi:hypothetical protein
LPICGGVGSLKPPRFGEEQQAVFAGRRVERRAAFLPVGEQFGQARGSMTAPDRMWAPISEPFSRATAHDHYIEFH